MAEDSHSTGLWSLSVRELKAVLSLRNMSWSDCTTKEDFVHRVEQSHPDPSEDLDGEDGM